MRSGFVVLCALVLTSCARSPDPRNLACNPVEGIEQVLSTPGVFIGDMHGTQESPAFLRDLSCHAMKSARPLVVAMEYDAEDQAVLDQFLATSEEQAASRLLTATVHWTGNNDGRASPAMRDALLAIWRYAQAGAKVRLLAYDLWGSTSQQRDTASAKLLSEEKAKSDAAAYWIVFGGNVHARKTKGLPWAGSEDHEPLGYQIRDWNLIHLDARYRGGAGWACTGPDPKKDCAVMQLGPSCATDCPAHAVIWRSRLNPAYDGYYDVGKLTPSPPLNRD
jgi:hypothetical protein